MLRPDKHAEAFGVESSLKCLAVCRVLAAPGIQGHCGHVQQLLTSPVHLHPRAAHFRSWGNVAVIIPMS